MLTNSSSLYDLIKGIELEFTQFQRDLQKSVCGSDFVVPTGYETLSLQLLHNMMQMRDSVLSTTRSLGDHTWSCVNEFSF